MSHVIWKELDRWRDDAGIIHTALIEVESPEQAAHGNTKFWTCAGIGNARGESTSEPLTCLICLGEAPPLKVS